MPDETKPIKAHELLSDPSKWTKGRLARDVHGNEKNWDAEDAVCFCAMGAIARTTDLNTEYDIAVFKLDSAVKELGYPTIPCWNDQRERTFAEVHALLLKLDI